MSYRYRSSNLTETYMTVEISKKIQIKKNKVTMIIIATEHRLQIHILYWSYLQYGRRVVAALKLAFLNFYVFFTLEENNTN